jgi:hypothetical protein
MLEEAFKVLVLVIAIGLVTLFLNDLVNDLIRGVKKLWIKISNSKLSISSLKRRKK